MAKEQTVDTDVLNVLSNATKIGANLTLVGSLDRNLYTKTNKVIEAAGGKWDRKAKAHVFADSAEDAMDQIILTARVTIGKSVQQEFGYFPTPADIAKRALGLLSLTPGMRVLEPSAGKGGLAYPAVAAGAVVDCIELLEANFAALAGDVKLGEVKKADFLQVPQSQVYDRVLMNPPFARQADIDHVTHAHGFLKPGGKLVAIMSASVEFRDNAKTVAFRDLVSSHHGSIERLPDGSFKESGTSVNTVIVTMEAA